MMTSKHVKGTKHGTQTFRPEYSFAGDEITEITGTDDIPDVDMPSLQVRA